MAWTTDLVDVIQNGDGSQILFYRIVPDSATGTLTVRSTNVKVSRTSGGTAVPIVMGLEALGVDAATPETATVTKSTTADSIAFANMLSVAHLIAIHCGIPNNFRQP